MSGDREQSRRQFLKASAVGAVGAGLGVVSPSAAYGAAFGRTRSANETVRVGVMGVGGRGLRLAEYFAQLPGAEVAYVCDVDERRVAEAVELVSKHQKAPKTVVDFRRFLDDPEVDAMVNATPEHWHAPASILAIKAGKHVYVEKPCAHNPREGELLVEATRKYERVVQMGNQRRSWPLEQEAIARIHAGEIGPVHYARTWYANARPPIGVGQPVPVPSWLDWELWQGPAPRVPYRDNVVHYNWHWFWNWGTAESGNNGVHALDMARWGLQVDYPTVVASTGGIYFDDDDQETPDTQILSLDFGDGKTIMWEGLSSNRYGPGGTGYGVSFHGENGSLEIAGQGYRIYDRQGKLVREVGEKQSGEVDLTGGGSRDAAHLQNFCDAIRSGEKLNSPIDEGHKSTMLSLLGNIAYRTKNTLHIDPATGRIQDDPKAMKLWWREYAPGWEPTV